MHLDFILLLENKVVTLFLGTGLSSDSQVSLKEAEDFEF